MLKVFPKGLSVSGCALVTGFHGIGATGYWTIRYLIQNLKAERIGILESDSTPPVASNRDGRLVTPYELYRFRNLVFFKAEVQPVRGEEAVFYRELSEWIADAGLSEIWLVGGLDINLRTDGSSYRIAHTSAYTPGGLLSEARALEDERLIVGPLAAMLNHFEARDVPAVALLTYASTERVDPRAASVATTVLSQYHGFEIDVSPLIKGAEAFESEIAREEAKARRGAESIYT